jgi:UDP-N-acetylenolpyruvoylglucosamine reductase
LTTFIRRPGAHAAALNGKIVLPEHGAYDAARRAWNLAIDQRPAAVAFPESAQDVVGAARFAAEHGLRIAAQATGHNAGPLGPLGDTILVRTERMRGVEIDARERIARVRAGTLWLEVVEAAARRGLATLAGSSPDVGVVGYTLGGGMSFLARRYGLSSSNVHAIEAVTADGRVVRADRETEPDLFWAMRGGGGSFAVVTALELDLFPISHAYAGHLWYPIERGDEVLHAWRDLTQQRDLPDELTTVGRFVKLPPLDEIPEALRGKSFVIVEAYHVGDPAQAGELLSPLRKLGPVSDTIDVVPIPALSHLHMDPEQPMAGAGDGVMLSALPPDALAAFVEVAGAGFPLVSVELRHLEGELGRDRPENGALSSIGAQYALYAVGVAADPQLELAAQRQVEAIKTAMVPWTAEHMYMNFAETSRDPASFWTEQAYHRLRRIKAAVDPDDLIRSNHPLAATPATAAAA